MRKGRGTSDTRKQEMQSVILDIMRAGMRLEKEATHRWQSVSVIGLNGVFINFSYPLRGPMKVFSLP